MTHGRFPFVTMLQPRLIKREEAARYVSVSPNTFDRLVREGAMPKARRVCGTRRAWDRIELDAAIDDLPLDQGAFDDTWSDANAT